MPIKSVSCWKVEAVEGTSIITLATTATSLFGSYSEDNKEHEVISRKNVIREYHNYSTRAPTLVYGTHQIPNIKIKYNPTSPIGLYHFLGGSTEGDPSTIEIAETAAKPTLTIHHQTLTGVNHVRQLLGAKAVAIAGKISIDEDEMMEVIYAGKQITDGSPVLTTAPTFPEGIDTIYHGKPQVTWDVGVGDVALVECVQVLYNQNQNISVNDSGAVKTVNVHQFNPVELVLVGVLQTETQWDALMDEETIDITVRSYKTDRSKYKDFLFINCKPEEIQRIGRIFEDSYISTIKLKCEKISGSYPDEWGANFADWM